MLRLFSYPDLYGVADNNPYGLKIYAFLKSCKLAFQHEHILDTKSAPRGQLPYLVDGEKTVGDSDAIISHLITRYALGKPARHRSFGKTDARRSLLGHVLFALGRSPLLAAFPGSPSDDTSRHYRSSLGSGTGVQFYALPLSRYWTLRARGSLCQRYRGT
jgi:Glutathione S-transferase N-terminal domain